MRSASGAGDDALQSAVMRIAGLRTSRTEAFAAIAETARGNGVGRHFPGVGRELTPAPISPTPPYMTEAWYCCAEPGPEQVDLV